MVDKVQVDREEYVALLALRDEAHEMLVVQHAKLRQNYIELGEVNRRQVVLVNQALIECQALSAKLIEVGIENKRLAQLEAPEKLLERNKVLEEAVKSQHMEIKMLQRSELAMVCERLRTESKRQAAEIKALKSAISMGKP